tara:strand:- start:268 stop:540 length:273 start_codon:yes stop_codon:yes gene_type:complete
MLGTCKHSVPLREDCRRCGKEADEGVRRAKKKTPLQVLTNVKHRIELRTVDARLQRDQYKKGDEQYDYWDALFYAYQRCEQDIQQEINNL